MIVRFDNSALNDANSFNTLDDIFRLLEDGRHQWCVYDAADVLKSTWLKSHKSSRWAHRIRTLLDTAKPLMTRQRAIPAIVVGAGTNLAANECAVCAKVAHGLLTKPVRLILEDSICDGSFLRAVLLRFGKKKLARKLGEEELNWVKRKWSTDSAGDGTFFELIHAGGSRVGDILLQQWSLSPVAIIAVVDSDRRSPSQSITEPKAGSTWHNAVENARQAQPSPLDLKPVIHALPRREMENYIPKEALSVQYPRYPQKKCVEAICTLNDDQRHFYDMKRGFRDSLHATDDTVTKIWETSPSHWTWKDSEQQKLYASLPNDTKQKLCQGLGKEVWKCWQQDGKEINKTSMKKEAEGDLNRLVDIILEHL